MDKRIEAIFLLVICFSFSSCSGQNKGESLDEIFKKDVLKHVFIPAHIKWDTLGGFEPDPMTVIHKEFSIFYFKDDSTLYMFTGLNELENDSLLCCVENVRGYRGIYTFLNDSTVKVAMKRVLLHNNINFVDTLTMGEAPFHSFEYKGIKYVLTDKMFKESYARIEENILEDQTILKSINKQK